MLIQMGNCSLQADPKYQDRKGLLKMYDLFQREIARRAKEYEQFVPFCYDAGAAGYSLKSLYEILASGKIPQDLDALIRKHAEHWRPSGEIVESELKTRRIGP
jgi:hypothetical protein